MTRAIFLVLLLLLSSAALAQDKKPPAGMTDDQYKSMVDDIADAVAKKLEGERKGGKKGEKSAKPAEEAKPAVKSEPFDAIESLHRMRDQSSQFLAKVPDYPGTVAEYSGSLNFELHGERHRLRWMLLWLVATALAGIALEYAVRALLSRVRLRWRAATGASWMKRFLANASLDAVGLVAMIVVVTLLSDRWLPPSGPAAEVGSKILTLFFFWRFFAMLLEISFRPGDPESRVVAVDDADAKLLARALSLLILFYQLGDSWMHIQITARLPVSALEVAVLVDNIYSTICDLAFMWFTRHAAARWFAGLVEPGDGIFTKAKLGLAKYWLVPALMFEVFMSTVQYYGSISGNVDVSLGISTTLTAILMILLLESAMDLPRRLAPPPPAGTRRAPHGAELIADVVLMFGRLAFLLFVIRIWSVEVLALFTQEEFSSIRRNNIATGLIILFAYAIWKIASFAIDRSMGTAPKAIGPLNEDAVQAPGPASRVHTVLPLIRATIAVTIFVLLVLLVLSQLGVNITPLIAGASVLGLAISFGSQTLVKDIVSGIFYLVDDAFRVGDYIDTGRVKGTVEGFTLRSIKLRHQNGQVHTIPFGQLGAVTNFSRDWVTVKFNLRLARDVDMEKVRKTVKKIGQDMMADAELAPELLVPLKLQGVADIADNALVMRFKFTCKPTNPSIIQRQAVKRIYQTFNEKGINFASSAITVQTAAGQADPDPALAAAGAAAATAAAAAKPTTG